MKSRRKSWYGVEGGVKFLKYGRVLAIFKLDRDINEIKLWEKNPERSDDLIVSYRVNGRTAGRTH